MCACFGHFTEPVQPLPVLESAYVNEEYTAILVTREHVKKMHFIWVSVYFQAQKYYFATLETRKKLGRVFFFLRQ